MGGYGFFLMEFHWGAERDLNGILREFDGIWMEYYGILMGFE